MFEQGHGSFTCWWRNYKQIKADTDTLATQQHNLRNFKKPGLNDDCRLYVHKCIAKNKYSNQCNSAIKGWHKTKAGHWMIQVTINLLAQGMKDQQFSLQPQFIAFFFFLSSTPRMSIVQSHGWTRARLPTIPGPWFVGPAAGNKATQCFWTHTARCSPPVRPRPARGLRSED